MRARRALAPLAAVVLLTVALPMGGTAGAFSATVTNTGNTAATKNRFLCADLFGAPKASANAYFEYRLSDGAGAAKATDVSTAKNDGAYTGSVAADATTPPACQYDDGQPYQLDGSSSGITTSVSSKIVTDFSIEVWFKTTVAGGKLLGFEASQSGTSTQHDKHFYVGSTGRVYYGVYDNGNKVLASGAAVNDGRWHHVVATTSPTAGSTLYLDGVVVDSSAALTAAEGATGYWRIGFGRLSGNWTAAVADSRFTGSLRFAAAYKYVLTSTEVLSAYSIGKP